MIAYHVLQTLKRKNISVPGETGVVTFDNYPFAQYMDPPLTAVDVDTFGIGEQAAFQLIHKIKRADSGNQQTLISTRLLIRESSRRGHLCQKQKPFKLPAADGKRGCGGMQPGCLRKDNAGKDTEIPYDLQPPR